MASILPDEIIAQEACLSIGGVGFRISAGGRRLRQDASAACRPFLVAPSRLQGDEVVRVHLEVSPRPSFDGIEIFGSEATWSILARGGERAVVFREPASAEVRYVARFRPGSRTVSVLCSPRLLDSDQNDPALESPFRYPLDQILTMYALAGRGFIVHSAGLVLGGRGLVFPGVSGAGKSTFARLAGARTGWLPLSDDRTVLRLQNDRPSVYGTPWPGEGRVAENRSAMLAGLLFLEKGPGNEVRPISPAESLSRLFPVISIPWFDREVLPEALSACERIAETVPGAILGFRPEAGAAEAVENFIGPGF